MSVKMEGRRVEIFGDSLERMGLDRRLATQETWDKYVDFEHNMMALFCLDDVCLHSPNSPLCMKDRAFSNFDTSIGYSELNHHSWDYVRCGDCDSLMYWPWWDEAEPETIEPHSASCWLVR